MTTRVGWRRDTEPFHAVTRSDIRVSYDVGQEEFVVRSAPPLSIELLRLDQRGVHALEEELAIARQRAERGGR